MRRFIPAISLVLLALAGFPLTAQGKIVHGVGLRGGVTMDPDQVHVGMHFDMGMIGRNVRVQPNIEVGFGDNITLVALNPELFYIFPVQGAWFPYAGGGLGINIYNWDNDFRPRFRDNTEVEAGLNLLAGIETRVSNRSRLFFEAKVGVGDSPDFKVAIGFTMSR